jgi:hypothetical protein
VICVKELCLSEPQFPYAWQSVNSSFFGGVLGDRVPKQLTGKGSNFLAVTQSTEGGIWELCGSQAPAQEAGVV